ncbi:MAG: ParB/RepB/Spo0J family partition protein [Fimbriimonadaceae bacterium]
MRRSLGKGLSHLITEQLDVAPTEASVDSILPNKRQPRSHFADEALAELAASIAAHGVLQPLLVRPLGVNRYELIAGERRLRAAKLAGLRMVPIVVRASDGRESLELALVENLQREDIGALERAHAYKQLSDEFGLTQDQIADKVGKARVSIANTLRLLRLPEPVLSALQDGHISEGHARALLMFGSPSIQLAMLQRIIKAGLSVREVEAAASPAKQAPPIKEFDPNWEALQEAVSKRLGSPVCFRRKPKGGGQMIVSFYNDDDLDRILHSFGLAD